MKRVLLLSASFAAAVSLCGCKSGPGTTDEGAHASVPGEAKVADEDCELYWHERGSDAARAVWSRYRLRADNAILRNAKGDGPLEYWFAAQAFDVLLDSVGSFWRKDLAAEAVDAYFRDFAAVHPDRRANVYNDDILWWAVACTRAARITGERRYLEEAQELYDHLWRTQVDNALGGGMWWRSDVHGEKNACGNFPAVIAALNLYAETKDTKYLLQGRALYRWAAARLFDRETGAVYDRMTADGERVDSEFSYNSGTFIGASLRLYRATGSRTYLANAIKAADHLVSGFCRNGVLRPLGQGDGGAFNGIAVRYLAELARRPGCGRFREFLLANARAAWTSRRLSDGINGPDWSRPPLADETVEPQTAVSAAMLYFAVSRAFR